MSVYENMDLNIPKRIIFLFMGWEELRLILNII